MKKETKITDLQTIDPKTLPELQGWEEKQREIVKNHPFVAIIDTETYETAKKHRTALVTARTDIQKQDKLIASHLKNFRQKVSDVSNELISITFPHEEKQQEEVKKYEAIKEAEKARKEEEERQRVLKIKNQIDEAKLHLQTFIDTLTHEYIINSPETSRLFTNEEIKFRKGFDFEEFKEVFDSMIGEKQTQYFDKCNLLKEQENQRLENERLAREAEEANKKQALLSERMVLIKEHLGHGPDFEIDELFEMSKEEFDSLLSKKRLAHAKAKEDHEKREAEEAERQAKLDADKKKLAEQQEEVRKKEESENKMVARTKRLTDELGLVFNYKDAFVSETLAISLTDVKKLNDVAFDNLVGLHLANKNKADDVSADFEVDPIDIEVVNEPSGFEQAISENIERNADKPKMIDFSEIDFTDLKDTCQGYIDFVWDDEKYHEDNDYSDYVFECAIEALFGKGVFEIINKKRP